MINTTFKPYNLNSYGFRRVINIKHSYIFIVFCMITPFTNWLIPLFLNKIKGNIRLILFKGEKGYKND